MSINIPLPLAFKSAMKTLFSDEADSFFEALDSQPPVSIRYNPTKSVAPKLDEIPWTKTGEYLPVRPVFTLDPAYHTGAYYVQEASSMLIQNALDQLDFSEHKHLTILDLCAAPGGKSTLLAQQFPDNSLLVCNEIIKSRAPILKENLTRWGYPNVVVTSVDSSVFANAPALFDIILVDAPCSGEGMFRKDPAARNEWSENNVQLCAARQKKILSAIETALKPGGILLFSTCTYNDSENIDNVNWLTNDFDFESLKLDFKPEFGVTEIQKNNVFGYQCYPHKVKGEGFFLSVLKKNGTSSDENSANVKLKHLQALDKKELSIVSQFIDNQDIEYLKNPINEIFAIAKNNILSLSILEKITKVQYISHIGEVKGKDFIPGHFLAMSAFIKHHFESIELTKNEALHFLKKENILLEATQGWYRMTYEGNGLGWAKVLPNRINNYLPKDWRIRMEIE